MNTSRDTIMIIKDRPNRPAEASKHHGAERHGPPDEIEIPLDGSGRGYDDLTDDLEAQGRFWQEHAGLEQIKEMRKKNEKTGENYVQKVFKRAGRADHFMVVYDPYHGYEHFVPDVMAPTADQGPTAEEARQEVLKTREQGGDWQGTLEQNRETLFAEYKIHLQPKKEYIPIIIDRLIKLTDERPEVRRHISAFKAKLGGSIKTYQDGSKEQMPEIVVYPKLGAAKDADGKTEGRKNMEMVLAVILDEMRGLEDLANGQVPRENARVNDLVFVAQGGGDLKNDLKELGVIDQYMEKDADGRYSFRKGEGSPSAEELEAGRRRLAAEARARVEQERRSRAEREQEHLSQARNGLERAYDDGAAGTEPVPQPAADGPDQKPAGPMARAAKRFLGMFKRRS